jgi:hypothetical protein
VLPEAALVIVVEVVVVLVVAKAAEEWVTALRATPIGRGNVLANNEFR